MGLAQQPLAFGFKAFVADSASPLQLSSLAPWNMLFSHGVCNIITVFVVQIVQTRLATGDEFPLTFLCVFLQGANDRFD